MTFNIRTKYEKMKMEDTLILRFTPEQSKAFDIWLKKKCGVKV